MRRNTGSLNGLLGVYGSDEGLLRLLIATLLAREEPHLALVVSALVLVRGAYRSQCTILYSQASRLP